MGKKQKATCEDGERSGGEAMQGVAEVSWFIHLEKGMLMGAQLLPRGSAGAAPISATCEQGQDQGTAGAVSREL